MMMARWATDSASTQLYQIKRKRNALRTSVHIIRTIRMCTTHTTHHTPLITWQQNVNKNIWPKKGKGAKYGGDDDAAEQTTVGSHMH